MTDEIDRAQEMEQAFLNAALSNRKHEILPHNGACHWCFEKVESGCFCDSGCREDWERDQRMKKMNGNC